LSTLRAAALLPAAKSSSLSISDYMQNMSRRAGLQTYESFAATPK